MDSKYSYQYYQRQKLNGECERFYNFLNDINCGSKKVYYQIDQMILINSNFSLYDDDAWNGVIQTMKRFISTTVSRNVNRIVSE